MNCKINSSCCVGQAQCFVPLVCLFFLKEDEDNWPRDQTLSLAPRVISFLSESFIEPSTHFQQNCLPPKPLSSSSPSPSAAATKRPRARARAHKPGLALLHRLCQRGWRQRVAAAAGGVTFLNRSDAAATSTGGSGRDNRRRLGRDTQASWRTRRDNAFTGPSGSDAQTRMFKHKGTGTHS